MKNLLYNIRNHDTKPASTPPILQAIDMEEEQQRTIKQFIQFLEETSSEKCVEQVFPPWKLISIMNGKTLGKWYAVHKPEKDLERLKLKDPPHYEQLLNDRKQEENRLPKAHKNVQEWKSYLEQHPETQNAAERYACFVQESVFAFRPENYSKNDTIWDHAALLTYALFQNQRTDEYLLTMRDNLIEDSKEGIAYPSPTLIEHRLIEGKGRNLDDILEEACWLWTDHLLPLMRYMPLSDRKQMQTMEEAERLRNHFGPAARKKTNPARPLRAVFEFFPAFRHAYGDKNGFSRALNDIFGETGNLHYLLNKNKSSSNGNDEEKLNVNDRHFIDLYADMNDRDRGNFKQAFNAFTNTLPALNKKDEIFAERLSSDLSRIALAMQHGRGVLLDPNLSGLLLEMETKFDNLRKGIHPAL